MEGLSKYGFKTTKDRSYLMSKIKSSNTSGELILRKELWKLGYRYRIKSKLIGKPDIVFNKFKVVIFIDGEFWHGYNWEEKKRKIKANKSYWIQKIEKNIIRDQRNTIYLQDKGWKVLRFWEKEIKKELSSCIVKIESNLNHHVSKPPKKGALKPNTQARRT